MSLPTIEALAVVFTDALEDMHARQPATTPDLLGRQVIAGIAAVRDAVLDALIAESQSRVLLFTTWGGSESKDPPPAMALADWLREMKGTP